MSKYVDAMKQQGALVVPLVLNEDRQDLLKKLNKLNGVIFPGGQEDYSKFG